MKFGFIFGGLGVLFAVAAAYGGPWFWPLLWPAFSYVYVGAAYFLRAPQMLGKNAQGGFAWWTWLLAGPFLVSTWIAWRLLRLVRREDCYNAVTPTVLLGRRPLGGELPGEVTLIIDLTAEFPGWREPASRGRKYLAFPTLDATPPTLEQFRRGVELLLAESGVCYVHCAEGHGRSTALVAAYLLARGDAATVDEAEALIKTLRPLIRLRAGQRRMVARFIATWRQTAPEVDHADAARTG